MRRASSCALGAAPSFCAGAAANSATVGLVRSIRTPFASGVRKTASRSAWPCAHARPFSAPMTYSAVDAQSASVALAAIADAEPHAAAGRPVPGSRMWLSIVPPAFTARSEAQLVDSERSLSWSVTTP